MVTLYMILNSRPLDHFDTNADKRLSIEEFTELCRNLFVDTTGEVEGLNSDMYDYDPEAIFRKLTERQLSGGADFLDEFAYKKWIRSVLAPSGRSNMFLDLWILVDPDFKVAFVDKVTISCCCTFVNETPTVS